MFIHYFKLTLPSFVSMKKQNIIMHINALPGSHLTSLSIPSTVDIQISCTHFFTSWSRGINVFIFTDDTAAELGKSTPAAVGGDCLAVSVPASTVGWSSLLIAVWAVPSESTAPTGTRHKKR